jgi:hypothetical protein
MQRRKHGDFAGLQRRTIVYTCPYIANAGAGEKGTLVDWTGPVARPADPHRRRHPRCPGPRPAPLRRAEDAGGDAPAGRRSAGLHRPGADDRPVALAVRGGDAGAAGGAGPRLAGAPPPGGGGDAGGQRVAPGAGGPGSRGGREVHHRRTGAPRDAIIGAAPEPGARRVLEAPCLDPCPPSPSPAPSAPPASPAARRPRCPPAPASPPRGPLPRPPPPPEARSA